MGETWSMIHHGAKLLSNCEPVKPNKVSASKIQWCDKPRIDISIPKGRNWEEKRLIGPPRNSKI